MKMKWLAILLLVILLAFMGAAQTASAQGPAAQEPAAQEPVRFSDSGSSYVFGEAITFTTRVESDTPVRDVIAFITPEGRTTVFQNMQQGEDGLASLTIDVRQLPLPPFSRVSYYFEAVMPGGERHKSETFSFQYEDDRFTWQSEENPQFRVHWYADNSTLGQEILNIAGRGLDRAKTLIDANLPGTVDIYAYNSAGDLQKALHASGQALVAGHATPEMNMILISIPSGPERQLELERQIPHEIMHILQYQVLEGNTQGQPVWLIEGMASLAELYPNPEYQTTLQRAADAQELIPIQTLCAPFPRDALAFFRSYAQSESFVRYLHQNYGTSGLGSLIEQYRNGLGCEEGVTAALGVPLSQLEYRWKQEALGIDTGGLVMRNLSPYLLVGLLIMLPAALAFLPYHRTPQGKRS